MASNAVNTGTSGSLRIVGQEVGYSLAGNWSDVYWELWLDERASSPATNAASVGASVSAFVNGAQQGTLYAGNFGFSWGGGGLQSTLITSGTVRFGHYPDGSSTVTMQGGMAATGTSGAGGPAYVEVNVPVTITRVVPGTPTNVQAARVSDTQATVTWQQTSAPNGQPTANNIDKRVNGGAWTQVAMIAPTTSATVAVAPNQKVEFRVAAGNNEAGWSPFSASSAPMYTTPGAPTAASAAKDSSLNIVVGWTPNVAYVEHVHEVWHGTVSGGVTTWDAAPLASVPAGTSSYTHNAPNSAQVHVYRVRAKAGVLTSDYSTTGAVQLLVAPNKPGVPALTQFADKAATLVLSWVHNPADTTPQTAYEFAYSTNGGTTWTSTGKVLSGASSYTVPANTYAANVALTTRVRTWGSAATGGSEGTGASPWSDQRSITFKTAPTASVISPADGSTINDAELRVTLGFAQPESATFVKAEVVLLEGVVPLETVTSSFLAGIRLATPLENLTTYKVNARVQDSNGLWSSWVLSTFNVFYLPPPLPVLTASYLVDQGWVQVNVAVAEPGAGESAVATVAVARSIDGGLLETLVTGYPAAAELSFFDPVPTIHGTNTYTVTFTSTLGAQSSATVTMVTEECRRAFLSKGAGFSEVVSFGGNLKVSEARSVANATIQAAGRRKPIGLYGVETSVSLKASSRVFEDFGSTPDELREFLLIPGKACFRDATGRRTFGAIKGSVDYEKTTRASFSFNMTETS